MSEPDDWDHPPLEELEAYPMIHCPRCGREQVDMDGFGFVACLPDNYVHGASRGPHCGYCTHPSRSGSPWRCDLCGAEADDGLDAMVAKIEKAIAR
jgi:ribosomal protein L37AE/L43A